MKGLTIRRAITAEFTADQWELFDMPGRDEAARRLNQALTDAVNAEGATASSVWKAMGTVQRELADLGAADSEPQGLIDLVVDKVFDAD